MDTDTTPEHPYVPGWALMPGQDDKKFELPKTGPFLAWWPDTDWDGEPWYYAPDPDAEKTVQAAPVDSERYIKLDVLRMLHDRGPVNIEHAQKLYDWVTNA